MITGIILAIIPFGAPLIVWLYARHSQRKVTEFTKRHFMDNWGAKVEMDKNGFIVRMTTIDGNIITYS